MTKLGIPVGDVIHPADRSSLFPMDMETAFLFMPLFNEDCDCAGGNALLTNNALFKNNHQFYDGINDYTEFANAHIDTPTESFAVSVGYIPHAATPPALLQLISIGDAALGNLAWTILINADGTPLTSCSDNGTTNNIMAGGAASVDLERPTILTYFKYGTNQEVWINGKFGKRASVPATIFNSSATLQIGRNPLVARHYSIDLFWVIVQHGDLSTASARRSYHESLLRPDLVRNV